MLHLFTPHTNRSFCNKRQREKHKPSWESELALIDLRCDAGFPTKAREGNLTGGERDHLCCEGDFEEASMKNEHQHHPFSILSHIGNCRKQNTYLFIAHLCVQNSWGPTLKVHIESVIKLPCTGGLCPRPKLEK